MKKNLFQNNFYWKKYSAIQKGFFILLLIICNGSIIALTPIRAQVGHGTQKMHAFMEPGWVYDKTVNHVDFYHKIISCEGKNAVVLKFINKNSYKVKVSWKEAFETAQVKIMTEAVYGEKELVLSAGETLLSPGCEGSNSKQCLVLSQQAFPHYNADIIKFEFKDILITPIK